MNDAGERAFVLAYQGAHSAYVRTKKCPVEEEERAPSVGSECKIFLSFLPSFPRRWEKMALEIVEEEEEEEAGVASGEGVMMEAGEVDIS